MNKLPRTDYIVCLRHLICIGTVHWRCHTSLMSIQRCCIYSLKKFKKKKNEIKLWIQVRRHVALKNFTNKYTIQYTRKNQQWAWWKFKFGGRTREPYHRPARSSTLALFYSSQLPRGVLQLAMQRSANPYALYSNESLESKRMKNEIAISVERSVIRCQQGLCSVRERMYRTTRRI